MGTFRICGFNAEAKEAFIYEIHENVDTQTAWEKEFGSSFSESFMATFAIKEVNFLASSKQFEHEAWKESVASKWSTDGIKKVQNFVPTTTLLHVEVKVKLKEGKTIQEFQDFNKKFRPLLEATEGIVCARTAYNEATGMAIIEETWTSVKANLNWMKVFGEAGGVEPLMSLIEPTGSRFMTSKGELATEGFMDLVKAYGGVTYETDGCDYVV